MFFNIQSSGTITKVTIGGNLGISCSIHPESCMGTLQMVYLLLQMCFNIQYYH